MIDDFRKIEQVKDFETTKQDFIKMKNGLRQADSNFSAAENETLKFEMATNNRG